MTDEAILKQIEATYGIGVGSNRASLRKERLAIIKLTREEGSKVARCSKCGQVFSDMPPESKIICETCDPVMNYSNQQQ